MLPREFAIALGALFAPNNRTRPRLRKAGPPAANLAKTSNVDTSGQTRPVWEVEERKNRAAAKREKRANKRWQNEIKTNGCRPLEPVKKLTDTCEIGVTPDTRILQGDE